MSLAIDEIAYAVTARLAGLGVREVSLGRGMPQALFTLGNSRVRLGPGFWFATRVTTGPSAWLRTGLAIALSARLIAMAALAMLGWRSRNPMSKPNSVWHAQHIEDATHRHDLDAADALVAARLKEDPRDVLLLLCAARLHLERAQFAAARSTWEALMTPQRTPMVNANLAWLAFRERAPARLEFADTTSAETLASGDLTASAFGTRGAVLLWKGELEPACTNLEVAYRYAPHAFAAASCASRLASAWAKRGDQERAKQWLKRALRAAPKCSLLPEAESALAAHD